MVRMSDNQSGKRSPAWALVVLVVLLALGAVGLSQCSSSGASGRGSSTSLGVTVIR